MIKGGLRPLSAGLQGGEGGEKRGEGGGGVRGEDESKW